MFSFHPHCRLLCVSSLWGVAKIEMLLETGVTSLFLEFCLGLRSSYFRSAVISVVNSTQRFPGVRWWQVLTSVPRVRIGASPWSGVGCAKFWHISLLDFTFEFWDLDKRFLHVSEKLSAISNLKFEISRLNQISEWSSDHRTVETLC